MKAAPPPPPATSTGRKILMAVTGLALFAYLPVHLAGNLMVFAGRDTFNRYSHVLVSNPLIYLMEAGLIAIFVLHIYNAIINFAANRKARPQPYLKKAPAGHTSRRSAASRTMIWTGIWTLLFIGVHLQGIKFGTHYEIPGEAEHVRDLYRTQVEVLARPQNAAFYLVSAGIIGFHLWHGFWSAWQSLGLGSSRWTPRLVTASKVFAVLLSGGFMLIVLCVFLGLFVPRVTP